MEADVNLGKESKEDGNAELGNEADAEVDDDALLYLLVASHSTLTTLTLAVIITESNRMFPGEALKDTSHAISINIDIHFLRPQF